VRLARHDVQLGHWTFLRILWEQDGLTQRELSDEAGFMEPITVIALRSMESLGYVTREHRPNNRKNLYVFLTPKGRRLKQALVPLAEEVNAIALTGVCNSDIVASCVVGHDRQSFTRPSYHRRHKWYMTLRVTVKGQGSCSLTVPCSRKCRML